MNAAQTDFVLASLSSPPSVWRNFPSLEAAAAVAPEANAYNVKLEPYGAPKRHYQPMTHADYLAAERAHYLSQPLKEVSNEAYDEMLNVLPPKHWEYRDGVERFCLSEHQSGPYTQQFAQKDGRSFTRIVDAGDPSTWITGAEVHKHIAEHQAAEAPAPESHAGPTMSSEAPTKVVVVISGGVLQAAYASDPSIRVELVDHDDLGRSGAFHALTGDDVEAVASNGLHQVEPHRITADDTHPIEEQSFVAREEQRRSSQAGRGA